jgi:hypothetical protein
MNSTYYEFFDDALEAYSNYTDLQHLEEESDDWNQYNYETFELDEDYKFDDGEPLALTLRIELQQCMDLFQYQEHINVDININDFDIESYTKTLEKMIE